MSKPFVLYFVSMTTDNIYKQTMAFMLSVTGQIEYAEILAANGTNWHCKYEFVAGVDWKIVGGVEAGLSQHVGVGTNGEKVVFNLPVEVVYKSANPFGWPQIVVSLYNDMKLEGYGRAHLPLTPGVHKMDVALSKPQPSTILGSIASLFGYQPELVQPKMLASAEGNHLLRMVSNGEIRMSFNVLMKGFGALGYDVN